MVSSARLCPLPPPLTVALLSHLTGSQQQGEKFARWEGRGALPCAPAPLDSGWVCEVSSTLLVPRTSYRAQHTRPPSHLWGLPFVLEVQVKTRTRGHAVRPGRPPEIPDGCGGVAGSGRILNTRPSEHRTGASPASWPGLPGPGASRARRLQEGQEAAVLGRDIAVPPKKKTTKKNPPLPPGASGLDHCLAWPSRVCLPPPATVAPTPPPPPSPVGP